MGTLYVAEYATAGFAQIGGAVVQAPHETPLAEQVVNIGVSSAQSSAFNAATTVIRLHSDAICSVLFGANPTAAAANQRFAANQTEYKTVPRGQSYKVAVITNT